MMISDIVSRMIYGIIGALSVYLLYLFIWFVPIDVVFGIFAIVMVYMLGAGVEVMLCIADIRKCASCRSNK